MANVTELNKLNVFKGAPNVTTVNNFQSINLA